MILVALKGLRCEDLKRIGRVPANSEDDLLHVTHHGVLDTETEEILPI